VTPRAGAVPAWTWSGGNPEGFVWRQVHASQLGLHWAAAPEIAKRVVGAAIAGPASLQQPKPAPIQAPTQAPAMAMSSPSPAMPTVGAAPAPEMPSQVSGPDFGPPPGPGSLGPGSLGPGSLGPGSLGPGSLGPGSLGPGSLGPGSLGPGAPGERRPGEQGPGLGERVAAEFGAVYGAHSNGLAIDRPPQPRDHALGERSALPSNQAYSGRPASPGQDLPGRARPMSDQALPERRPEAAGPGGANLGDTVDITAP
jgi:cobyrinic acid a,c-diamide synthase